MRRAPVSDDDEREKEGSAEDAAAAADALLADADPTPPPPMFPLDMCACLLAALSAANAAERRERASRTEGPVPCPVLTPLTTTPLAPPDQAGREGGVEYMSPPESSA